MPNMFRKMTRRRKRMWLLHNKPHFNQCSIVVPKVDGNFWVEFDISGWVGDKSTLLCWQVKVEHVLLAREVVQGSEPSWCSISTGRWKHEILYVRISICDDTYLRWEKMLFCIKILGLLSPLGILWQRISVWLTLSKCYFPCTIFVQLSGNTFDQSGADKILSTHHVESVGVYKVGWTVEENVRD